MGKEEEAQVRSWGFDHAFTWTDGPNAHYAPHAHAGKTTHHILAGDMTLWYPREEEGEEKKKKKRGKEAENEEDGAMAAAAAAPVHQGVTYGVGARVDVDAGRVHEVRMGPRGCTYVVGE
ncbi:hypothetical protein JDV02_009847 [Purpureocillium takamizusanense]|uniref:Uncharacterized protein n=1 Tax=Purpureocillium takamizusanense TaxID=2060973 RepID=A0A9Q8QMU2_9HYPO|nr:uncharacterized protein JDV02_009847 [Purpureocillium takamizusanense]UNI24069.1 hypothetical protein JDV02_009847 [Purpureocillium takamizusanense]